MKWKKNTNPLISFRYTYLTRIGEEIKKENLVKVTFHEPIEFEKIENEITAWLNNYPIKKRYPIYFFNGKKVKGTTREKRLLYLYSAIYHMKQDADVEIKLHKGTSQKPIYLHSSENWKQLCLVSCLAIVFFISYLFYKKNYKYHSYFFFIFLMGLVILSCYC